MSPTAFEEMVLWSIANPADSRYNHAGVPALQMHFRIGSHRAKMVAREAARRQVTREANSEPDADESVAYEESEHAAKLVTVSREIRTVDDALAYAEIDLEKWVVERSKINYWESASLDADKQPQVTPLWQVVVWLKPKVASALEVALEALVERMPAERRLKAKAADRTGERMVEVALYDLHFGMLAWAPETGEDYDVSIARRVTADAIAQIADRTKGLGVTEFLFPIGNDLFHINDPTGLTPASRNQLDVDTRLPKIIEEVGMAMRDAVGMLSDIAPVKLIWVPGNHDPQTSYWLLRELAAWYRDDERVIVDTSPKPRKVVQYGINLIWLLHGADLAAKNEKALAGLFASEAADVWAPNQYREIHRGHTHKKDELWFAGVETYGGVVVRTIPSLVGTDAWHFRKGYVKTTKTAQFFVWNRDYGLESVQDIHVDISHYKHGKEIPNAV